MTKWMIVVGVFLVIVGVVALFKLSNKGSETSFDIGPVKIKTKSPALALIVLGLLCMAARFSGVADSALPKDVQASYLALVDAYNRGDRVGYYAHFAQPMDCFYSKPNASIAEERAELSSHLEVNPEDLTPLDVKSDRVELCDRGRWRDKNTLHQQHKIVVMKKFGAEWRVTVETGSEQSLCYSSPNAAKC